VLEPLDVGVAADEVAQHQVGLGQLSTCRCDAFQIAADVSLYIGAVVGRIANFFRGQDWFQRLVSDGQLKRIDFGIDRYRPEGFEQLHAVSRNHQRGCGRRASLGSFV
jgi:hypothetical protein